jgi:hypothetical protein
MYLNTWNTYVVKEADDPDSPLLETNSGDKNIEIYICMYKFRGYCKVVVLCGLLVVIIGS